MKKIIKVIVDFGNRTKEDNINAYASSCAFFIFLSIIPFIILALSIVPYTPLTEEDILLVLTEAFPRVGEGIFSYVISDVYAHSIGITVFASITTLWTAGKGVQSLINGLNAIDRRVDRRSWFLVRLISSLYTLILMVGLLAIILLIVLGKTLLSILTGRFPNLHPAFSKVVDLRSLIMIGLLFFMILLCYSILPVQRIRFKEAVPGAVFTAVSWTLFSYLFSLYISKYDAFSMYGNFTAVIILLIWLYFLMYFLFMGAHLNKYFRPVLIAFSKKREERKIRSQLESLEED